MGVLYRYLLIVLACGAMLIGVQAPSFVDQYRHRLDAHLAELEADLRGWQEIADRNFRGSLQGLIDYHDASTDPVFRAEAEPLRTMLARRARFLGQRSALGAPLPRQLLFLATRGDRELLGETRAGYSFTVPLDTTALLAGGTAAAAVLVLVEVVAALARTLLRRTPPAPTGSMRRRSI